MLKGQSAPAVKRQDQSNSEREDYEGDEKTVKP